MRILHTSDWHLGRTLHGYSRHLEHQQLVDELVDVAADVDLVIVSGDVFENANPPIEAEELFFDALARLSGGGKRAVVVIAGNHDSPDRLTAASPLAVRHGAWIFGRPADVPLSGAPIPSSGGPSLLKLDLPAGRVVVAAVPYPSEARLRQSLSPSLDERDLQAAYNRRIGELFAELAQSFEPGAVNLATSHLAVRSCMPSGSERVLIGGAWQVDGSVFPASAQYVALGHLHLQQPVPDAPTAVHYAGSPLALRFSENEFPRAHLLIEVEPGGPARVTPVPVRAGRALVTWEVNGIPELEQRIAAGEHAGAFVDLSLRVDARLTHAEMARIKRMGRDFVRVRAILPEAVVTRLPEASTRRDLPLSELFGAFYRDQTGNEPAPELTELLLDLVEGEARPRRAVG
ncbi:MAG: exonuclease subunit SbcD [Myxococcota bacterium]